MTTVLIVDDSLTVRMDLHEAFKADGFRSILCADGAQARAAFVGAHFDVAVLDVLLPDADARSAAQRTARIVADPPVLTPTAISFMAHLRGVSLHLHAPRTESASPRRERRRD